MVNHSFTQNIGTRVQVWKFKNSNIWGLQIIQWQQVWSHKEAVVPSWKYILKTSFNSSSLTFDPYNLCPPSQWTLLVCAWTWFLNLKHGRFLTSHQRSSRIVLSTVRESGSVLFFLMSDVGETEYLHLRCYSIKLAPENTGFYFSYRENEMLPVLVKYFGNFCTKIEWQNSARWFNSEKRTLFTVFLCSQSGTVAAVCLFNIQEAKKKWLAGQFHSHGSDRGESFLPEAPRRLSVIILNISQTDSLDICLKGCY